MRKLLSAALLTGAVAGVTALVWNAATTDTKRDRERFPAPEVDPDALSNEERDLLLRELATHL